MDKINRLAGNLGIDENFAAAVQAHLKKTGQIPADEPGEGEEADGEGADMASETEVTGEASAPEAPGVEAHQGLDFFT